MFKIKIVFPERFPRPDKYSWGISYEYLPGWPELTEEKIIRLCLCHTSYLHKLLKMHILQKKKSVNSRSSHQSCSMGKAVLKKFLNIHRKETVLESHFNRDAGLKVCNFIKRDSDTATQVSLPVNIAKCSRTPILKNIFGQLPLEFLRLTINISSQGLVSAFNSIFLLQGPLQCLKSSL